MLEDGRNCLFDVLVCKSFSRFGRNQTETLQSIKELRAKGIRIVFLEEMLDSEKDNSKFGLFAWLAEDEAQRTSQRIKMVWDSYNAEGKIHVTQPPYGYDYNLETKRFVINDYEAATVERIFILYLKGFGFNKIAKILMDDSIPTKRGGKWAGVTIRGILTNEFYTGTLIKGKTKTLDVTMKENIKVDSSKWYKHENDHDAIINAELFEHVNNKINQRCIKAKNIYSDKCTAIVHSKGRNSNKSLFSNLLICGECGSHMTIKKNKHKPYYQCMNYDKLSLKCGHRSNSINEEMLMNIIGDELRNLSETNSKVLKQMHISKNNQQRSTRIKPIDNKCKKQIKMANKILEYFTDDKITEKQFEEQNNSIQKSIEVLNNRKESLELEIKKFKDHKQDKSVYEGIESILNKSFDKWSNAELKSVVDYIKVYTDGTIKVKVKYFN